MAAFMHKMWRKACSFSFISALLIAGLSSLLLLTFFGLPLFFCWSFAIIELSSSMLLKLFARSISISQVMGLIAVSLPKHLISLPVSKAS
ncbi:hypothetical protein QQ045_022788 [Rhodiola kirilowii]